MRARGALVASVALATFAACTEHDGLGAQWDTLDGPACGAFESAPAGMDRVAVTAETHFDPFGLVGPPTGRWLAAAELICPGQQDPSEPCPSDRTHILGFRILTRITSEHATFVGWLTIAGNAYEGADGEGALMGTWVLDIDDDDGVWTGRFAGTRSYLPGGCDGTDCWVEELALTGCGEGGSVDGQRVVGSEDIFSFTQQIAWYHGYVDGYLFVPQD